MLVCPTGLLLVEGLLVEGLLVDGLLCETEVFGAVLDVEVLGVDVALEIGFDVELFIVCFFLVESTHYCVF